MFFFCQVWSETTAIQLLKARFTAMIKSALTMQKLWLVSHANRNMRSFVFHVWTCKPVIHTQRLTCLFQLKPDLVNINIKTKKTESQTVLFTVLNEKIKFHQMLCANKTINRIENLTSRSTGRLAPSLGEVTVWSHSVSRSKNQPHYTACLSTSGEHSTSRQVGRGARRVCSNGSQTNTKPETTDVGKHLSNSSFTVVLTCGDISRWAAEMHLCHYKESTSEPMRKDE